jgi:hypothetical protein
LAIITMQMMTKISWAHRDAVAVDAAVGAVVTAVLFPSPDSQTFIVGRPRQTDAAGSGRTE